MKSLKLLKRTPKSSSQTDKFTPARFLDFIIGGVITLIFFLCPLFFTGLVAQGAGFEKMTLFYLLVLVGMVAWVTKGVVEGELNLKRTPLDIPILATFVVFVISTILSVSSKDSLIGSYGNSSRSFVTFVVFVLFYYLLVNNLNLKRIKLLFWSLIVSSSLLAIYSLLQIAGIFLIPLEIAKTKSFNPIGTLSGLTMYLVIVLPLFIVAVAQIKKIASKMNEKFATVIKVILGIITLVLLILLALLSGFTFWPVAIVGSVIVLMFFLSKIINIDNNNLLIPLGAFLILIIMLVLGNFNFVDLGLPSEVSLSRGASWDIAKSSIKENPIFGSGPGTFYYNFSKFKGEDFNASPLWSARFDSGSGILFEFLSTVGILGTLGVVVIVLIALSVVFLSLIKNEENETSSIILSLFAGFVSAIIFSVLFAQNNSLFLASFLISALAVAAGLIMYPEKLKSLKLSFRSSPKYALALAAIFLCVSAGVVIIITLGFKMYMADYYSKKALLDPSLDNKITNFSRAIALAPYQDSYYLSLANVYMAKANQAAQESKDQSIVGGNLSQSIEIGKKAVEIAPNKAINNESLALIYENASFYTRGALEWAENFYNKVIELEPSNPVPHLRLALVNMSRANAETDEKEQEFYVGEAIKNYDTALSKKGDLAAAYYGKSIALERLNNLTDAIDQLLKANLIAPDNLDYRFELGRMYFNKGVTQPNLAQNATKEITESEISGEEGNEEGENISVTSSQSAGTTIGRNDDINASEQVFLSIVRDNANHANALYSLAVLYQKIGEKDNLKLAVDSLLNILPEDETKEAVKEQFKEVL